MWAGGASTESRLLESTLGIKMPVSPPGDQEGAPLSPLAQKFFLLIHDFVPIQVSHCDIPLGTCCPETWSVALGSFPYFILASCPRAEDFP